MLFSGVRLAYSVKLDDKVISTVSDKNVYYAAVNLVEDMVEGDDVLSVLPEIEIKTVVTTSDTVDSCDTVADAIINNTDEIIPASKLVLNDEVLGYADTNDLEAALENRKSAFNIEGVECENEFCDNVVVEDGYFIKSEISDISELEEEISSIEIKTTVKEVSEQSIPYKTVTNEAKEKPMGYVNTEQTGKDGTVLITCGVVYINGVEVERTALGSEIVSEPVNEILTVGTAKSIRVRVSGQGFVFPLPSGVWQVSCAYGEDGHKGVDLRAPLGTSIMAVAPGTVVKAEWYKDYGNCVKIDHGNGMYTLYAHATKLCVNVGDTVSAGDVIALVGSTGRSTGNHLHFEVYKGTERVNPEPYIGLK